MATKNEIVDLLMGAFEEAAMGDASIEPQSRSSFMRMRKAELEQMLSTVQKPGANMPSAVRVPPSAASLPINQPGVLLGSQAQTGMNATELYEHNLRQMREGGVPLGQTTTAPGASGQQMSMDFFDEPPGGSYEGTGQAGPDFIDPDDFVGSRDEQIKWLAKRDIAVEAMEEMTDDQLADLTRSMRKHHPGEGVPSKAVRESIEKEYLGLRKHRGSVDVPPSSSGAKPDAPRPPAASTHADEVVRRDHLRAGRRGVGEGVIGLEGGKPGVGHPTRPPFRGYRGPGAPVGVGYSGAVDPGKELAIFDKAAAARGGGIAPVAGKLAKKGGFWAGAKGVGSKVLPGLGWAFTAMELMRLAKESSGADEESQAIRESFGMQAGAAAGFSGDEAVMSLEDSKLKIAAELAEMQHQMDQRPAISSDLQQIIAGNNTALAHMAERPQTTLAETLALRGLM